MFPTLKKGYKWVHIKQKKNASFNSHQLYWIDLLKRERKQDCTHVDHNQLDLRYHLKSCTNIGQVFVWLHRYSIILKQHIIGVYDYKMA